MPSVNCGQSLSLLVNLIAKMTATDFIKSLVQRQVTVTIKSFLKIKKLNLTKNKYISNCE